MGWVNSYTSAHSDIDTESISELEEGFPYGRFCCPKDMVNLRVGNNEDLQVNTGSKQWRYLMFIILPWLIWRLKSMRTKTGSLIWMQVEFTTLWIRVRFATLRLPEQTIHTDLPFRTSNCSHTKPYCKLQTTENITVQFNMHHIIQHCTTQLVTSAGNTQVVFCSHTSCWQYCQLWCCITKLCRF